MSHRSHRKTAAAMPRHHETRQELEAQHRLERQRAERTRRRHEQIKRGSMLGGALLAVAIIVMIGAQMLGNRSGPGAKASISGVVTYAQLSRDHTTATVTYPQTPPVGGPHSTIWQNCGTYTTAIRDENAVHSLEHGAVWMTYRPDLSAADIAKLQGLVKGRNYTLLSPYPGLSSPVVISAWGLQLRVQSASDPRLAEFIARYANGPQSPEPNGECSGGVGTPLQ